jgi:hypothetical protein
MKTNNKNIEKVKYKCSKIGNNKNDFMICRERKLKM